MLELLCLLPHPSVSWQCFV